MSGPTARVKDVLLEHISRDIKKLQSLQSDMSTVVDMVTNSNRHVQSLCEHLDHILMHGLREYVVGYWPFVQYFTRSEAVHTISGLRNIHMDVGRGRAWMYLALNEQVVESYVRMFIENQEVAQNYYLRESFVRDVERLVVLQTLVAGLDFISFDLTVDCDYLDHGPTEPSSRLGIARSSELTPDVEPTFISSVTPQTDRRVSATESTKQQTPPTKVEGSSGSFITSIIGNVFGGKEQKPPPADDHQTTPNDKPADVEGKSLDDVQPCDQEPNIEIRSHSPVPIQPQLDHTVESSSFNSSVLQRMTQAGSVDQVFAKNVEECDSGNGTQELEDELVVRVSKGTSRQKKSHKSKKKKKKQKTEEKGQPDDAASVVSIGGRTIDEGVVSQQQEGVVMGTVQQEEGVVSQQALSRTDSLSRLRSNAVSFVPDVHTEENVFGLSGAVEDSEQPQHNSPGGKEEASDPGVSSLLNEAPVVIADDRSSPDLGVVGVSPDLPVNTELLSEAIEEPYEPRINTEDQVDGSGESPLVDHTPFGYEDPDGGASSTSASPEVQPKQSESETSSPGNFPEVKVHRGRGQSDSDFEMLSTDEFNEEGAPHKTREVWIPSPVEPVVYEESPSRPLKITDNDKMAADVRIDENTRLVFSLDILFEDDEQTRRLIQVATPTGIGLQRSAYILITNQAVYVLRKDGVEGIYSREAGIRYTQFDHIVIGLGWQSLIFVYHASHQATDISQSLGGVSMGEGTERCVVLTGSEAVSRSIVESVSTCAAHCAEFLRAIPLNRDDESRIEAIEKELIKLGSHTSMDIVRYSLVNWEQVSGEPPPSVAKATSGKDSKRGHLLIKTSNMLGMPVWKQAFFKLKRGRLYQYSNEGETVAKNIYTIRDCGGCTRATGEGKPFAISVLDKEGTSLVIAASNEEELTQWLQALCEAVIGKEVRGSPSHRRTCLNCALLLTQNKLHILLEDWTKESVQLVTSCEVVDVNDVSVDSTLPLYCTISYDHGATQGLWLICFSSEFELGKFEHALATTWKEEFQINLQFSEVLDHSVRQRAHKAVELMQNSRYRSDSVTRGRSEFTYSAAF